MMAEQSRDCVNDEYWPLLAMRLPVFFEIPSRLRYVYVYVYVDVNFLGTLSLRDFVFEPIRPVPPFYCRVGLVLIRILH